MELPKRKPTRLKEYDYSQNGAYFVTICTQDRKCILGEVVPIEDGTENGITVGQGLAPAEIKLSRYGKIAEDQIALLENRYPNIEIVKYAIMPNHIHILISIYNETAGASPCPTLSDIICSFKSLTTRLCGGGKIFQSSFHDHIIRDERDFLQIWQYIDTNHLKWQGDFFYIP